MEHMGINILGLFPTIDWGTAMSLCLRTTSPSGWASIVPDQSVTINVEYLVKEMICPFSAPEELYSNQRSNFKATMLGEVCQWLGIKKTQTTAAHPERWTAEAV